MFVFFIFFLGIEGLFASTNTGGGYGVGNGGDAVLCFKGSEMKSIELLDYHESRYILDREFETSRFSNLSVEETYRELVSPLLKWDRSRYENYLNFYREFHKNSNFRQGTLFRNIEDSLHFEIEKGCEVRQLIIRKSKVIAMERRYSVNSDIWDHKLFTNVQKAGAILHEAIYEEALNYGHLNSMPTRRFNLLLVSNFFKDYEHYYRLLEDLELPLPAPLSKHITLDKDFHGIFYRLKDQTLHYSNSDEIYVEWRIEINDRGFIFLPRKLVDEPIGGIPGLKEVSLQGDLHIISWVDLLESYGVSLKKGDRVCVSNKSSFVDKITLGGMSEKSCFNFRQFVASSDFDVHNDLHQLPQSFLMKNTEEISKVSWGIRLDGGKTQSTPFESLNASMNFKGISLGASYRAWEVENWHTFLTNLMPNIQSIANKTICISNSIELFSGEKIKNSGGPYCFQYKCDQGNLVKNGGFSQGAQLFTSALVFEDKECCSGGQFMIQNAHKRSAYTVKNAMYFFREKEGRENGFYMLVDGPVKRSRKKVWEQRLSVVPGCSYEFSVDFANGNVFEPLGSVNLLLDGKKAIEDINGGRRVAVWKTFKSKKEIKKRKQVTLTIESNIFSSTGNNFALDNIVLRGL